MFKGEYKKIIAVDNNNENPRAVTYEEANQKGLMKRAARIFVVNDSKAILIQKRSRHISKPLLLDNSAAGHVDEGEEYIDAAIRELYEELGIKALESDFTQLPMVEETTFFSQNYLLRVSDDVQITIDPHETEAFFWYTKEQVDDLVANNSNLCSPSLVEVWSQIRDSIFI